jgi:multidrug efflux pump subunit AcrA (membrane-fusion protein)
MSRSPEVTNPTARDATPATNGRDNGRASRTPPSNSGRRVRVFSRTSLAGLLAVSVTAAAALLLTRPTSARPDVLLHKVKRETLGVTVTEKGTFESAENRDVICKVRAGNKGFASTINWVIDDGARVRAGDLLMVLDDSALRDQFREQKAVVDNAFAAMIKAVKDYEVTVEQNADDVQLKQAAVELAGIELEKYTGVRHDPALNPLGAVAGAAATLVEAGDYRRQLDELIGKVRLAESEVEQWRERSAWIDRMVKQKYMNAAQAQAERSRLDSAVENLRALRAQRDLLVTLDRRKTLTELTAKMESARRAVELAVKVAESRRIQADTERKSKTSVHGDAVQRLKEIEDQVRECRIHAPQGGMVVYFKQEWNRFSFNPVGLIEHGAQVKEGQKLLRIPNLELMQVNTKVHEAMVGRIKPDVRVSTGLVDGFRAGLMMNPDPFTRLVSQREDFLEVIRSRYRDREYSIARKGQAASVRVEAMPNVVLPGRVKSVANVASQADWWNSDVRLYQTVVSVEGRVEGLKPDMTAEVTIQVDGVSDVLTVPVQAVLGGAETGARRKVFVKTGTGYEQKEVALGLYNERFVEVRDGLAEGDEVVINPKVLPGGDKTKSR